MPSPPKRPSARADPSAASLLPSAAAHTKPTLQQRQSSTFRYHTFPHAPPRNVGTDSKREQKDNKMRRDRAAPTAGGTSSASDASRDQNGRQRSDSGGASAKHRRSVEETPLPKAQLAILAVISLAEQTALNSISPYLPAMASSFPEVKPDEVGLYVGLIASAFALAQFATNFLWGWLSDRVGRKPIVLLGTFLTALCFVAFGFCRSLWQAVVVQAMMGLVNGNAGVISTCLGEITDRSNQSRAFTYLPVIYGLGGITGPIVGGLLVFQKNPFNPKQDNPYPYLAPNLLSSTVLLIDMVLTMIFLEESLQEAKNLPPLKKRVGSLFAWIWQFTSSHRPTYMRQRRLKRKQRQQKNGSRAQPNGTTQPVSDNEPDDLDNGDDFSDTSNISSNAEETHPLLLPTSSAFQGSKVFTRDTVLLLITFLIFQLSNISFNSLYPIFAQGPPPTGRDLRPSEIGISLAFAGGITIIFQVGIFGRLRERVGNKTSYRTGLAGFIVAFLLMPWVGYKSPPSSNSSSATVWLWIELAFVLIVKTIAAVGGLTSALLLITNSAPSHAVLGTLNGLAQTLSAAGRAVGPFISGSLYTASTHVRPKGEALAFGIFAGIACVGLCLSFGIRGADLEAEGWEENGNGEDDGEGGNTSEDEENGNDVDDRQRRQV